jgi:antitoxin YefM
MIYLDVMKRPGAGGPIRQKNIVVDTVLEHVHYTVHMNAMTYTAARENLASTMDRVCVDHDPVIITRNRDQAVVMLSLADYESLQETAYLLRSPANARRLLASIENLNAGKTVRKNIKDLVEA